MCPSMAASTSVLDRLRFTEADPASASAVLGVACVAHVMGDTTTRERHCQHRPMGSPCTHRQQFHRLGVLARFCHVQRRLASLERLTPTHTRARSTVRGTHVAAKQPLATDGISKGDVCAELDEFLQGIHVAVGRGNDERRLAALRNTQQHHKQG